VTQNRDEVKQKQPTPKKRMSDFLIALLATAIPLLVLSVIDVGMVIAGGPSGFGIGVVSMMWVLAILASIGFAIGRRRQIALGILAGAAIGAVGLGLSCFAAISRNG
jgi:uncharacterized RDD family membrane protein YckC